LGRVGCVTYAAHGGLKLGEMYEHKKLRRGWRVGKEGEDAHSTLVR
jgi:hypothetical protein